MLTVIAWSTVTRGSDGIREASVIRIDQIVMKAEGRSE